MGRAIAGAEAIAPGKHNNQALQVPPPNTIRPLYRIGRNGASAGEGPPSLLCRWRHPHAILCGNRRFLHALHDLQLLAIAGRHGLVDAARGGIAGLGRKLSFGLFALGEIGHFMVDGHGFSFRKIWLGGAGESEPPAIPDHVDKTSPSAPAWPA